MGLRISEGSISWHQGASANRQALVENGCSPNIRLIAVGHSARRITRGERGGHTLWDYPCLAIKSSRLPKKPAALCSAGPALRESTLSRKSVQGSQGHLREARPQRIMGRVRQRARSVLLCRNGRLVGVEELRAARTLLGESQAADIVVAGHSGRILKNHGDGIDAAWFTPQRPIRGPRSSTG